MPEKTMSDFYDYMCLHYRRKTALVYGEIRYTFSDLEEKGTRLANALIAGGFKKGDRVAVLLPNSPEVMLIDYAFTKIGIVTTPLAAYLQVEDMHYILTDTGAQTLIFHESFRPRVSELKKALADEIRWIVSATDISSAAQEDEWRLQTLIDTGDSGRITASILPDDLYLIIYSGGTTGKPKGIMHTHRTWAETVVITMMEMGTQRNEIFLAATPLTHGARVYMIPVLIRGGSCIIEQGFDPKRFLAAIEREKITSTFVVPTMINALVSSPNLKKYDTRSLKNIIYGAAPIAPDHLKEAVRTFGPVFTQSYGQTEVPVAISILSKEDHVIGGTESDDMRFASCGRPSLLMDVKLLDDAGKSVPAGEPGEIVVRSPNAMLGYLNKPEQTRKTLRDGWLHTGDIARMDLEGYLYLVDRKKDMIVSGGFNVYPKEIEDILFEHPAVAGAAVIGVPDEKWGEAVKAIVVKKPGAAVSAEELIAFCKSKKGSIMSPKTVDFVDAIPATPLGKPDKKTIRKEYWKGRDRLIS